MNKDLRLTWTCPQGHVVSEHSKTCGICGAEMPAKDMLRIARAYAKAAVKNWPPAWAKK